MSCLSRRVDSKSFLRNCCSSRVGNHRNPSGVPRLGIGLARTNGTSIDQVWYQTCQGCTAGTWRSQASAHNKRCRTANTMNLPSVLETNRPGILNTPRWPPWAQTDQVYIPSSVLAWALPRTVQYDTLSNLVGLSDTEPIQPDSPCKIIQKEA